MKPNIKKGRKRIWIVVTLLYSILVFFYLFYDFIYVDYSKISSELNENVELAKFFREKGCFDGLADNIEMVKLQDFAKRIDRKPETETIEFYKEDALFVYADISEYDPELSLYSLKIPDHKYFFTELGASEHANEERGKTNKSFFIAVFAFLFLPWSLFGYIATRNKWLDSKGNIVW